MRKRFEDAQILSTTDVLADLLLVQAGVFTQEVRHLNKKNLNQILRWNSSTLFKKKKLKTILSLEKLGRWLKRYSENNNQDIE